MRIHYFQHVAFEGLGYIETWIRAKGYQLSATRWFEKDAAVPDMEQLDALIIMGGPMSVYDEYDYPWLREEKMLIQDCIQAGKKVLGICLGAQLIANCLGERVYKAKHRETGWFAVQPTLLCQQHSWLYNLFKDQPTVFHWHGEMFDIPYNGGVNLLNSQANINQAFIYGQHVLGLQFHLEVMQHTLSEMLDNMGHELIQSPFVQSDMNIRAGAVHIEQCNSIMAAILEHWFKA